MSKIGDALRNRDKTKKDPTLRLTKLMSRKRIKILSDISNWNDDIPCILRSTFFITHGEIIARKIVMIMK